MPALRQALHGWTVVAHDAAFVQSFLSDLLADIRAPTTVADLLATLAPKGQAELALGAAASPAPLVES